MDRRAAREKQLRTDPALRFLLEFRIVALPSLDFVWAQKYKPARFVHCRFKICGSIFAEVAVCHRASDFDPSASDIGSLLDLSIAAH